MKYNVTGIYKHEEVVDTESAYYKHWRESWRGKDYKDEKYAIEAYVREMLNCQVIDDDGHGTLSASSLEWTVKEGK